MRRIALLVTTTLTLVLAKAQLTLLPADDWQPVITKDGVRQTLLQLGGLNNPQVSRVDVDGDGALDYYLFDRAGDVHLAVGQSAEPASGYVDKSAYVRDWPATQHFVLLRDFDDDGVPDLFTSSSETGREGLLVYRGSRRGGRLQFSLVTLPGRLGSVLGYRTDSGDQLIFVARTDIPSIADIDGDGDLDILSFDPNGSFVYYYRNLATGVGPEPENHLRFELASTCYGGIYEDNFTSDLLLAPAAGGCGNPFADPPRDTDAVAKVLGGLHGGSTLSSYDIDGDGDLDLLVGDVQTSFLTALINTPSGKTDYFSSLVQNWPATRDATPVDVDFFPAAYFLEHLLCPDGCHTPALIVTPSNPAAGDDYQNVWLYDRTPGGQFVLRQRNFLTEAAFDHGSGTHLAMGQLDGAGLEDLIVGVESIYTRGAVANRESTLRYYQCSEGETCTEQRPAWLQALNQLLSPTVTSLDPALADMDGDGDLDLLIGNSDGGVTYARNVSSGGTVRFELALQTLLKINGVQASPAVGDVDGDGLPDLLIGERAGNINLFLNRGTRTQPNFSAAADDEFYGRIDLRTPGINGSTLSRPAFTTVAGESVLYVGSGHGRLAAYSDLPRGAGGAARLAAELSVRAGDQLDPCIGFDVTRQLPVVLMGNRRGGLQAYRIDATVGLRDRTPLLHQVILAPNPAYGEFRILDCPPDLRVDIYSALGQLIARDQPGEEVIRVALAAGVYEILTRDEKGVATGRARLVVQ